MEYDNGIRDYSNCNNCKYEGEQKEVNSSCEGCKWNPLHENNFETNDPSSKEIWDVLEKR